jgi:hypothetical protein
MSTQVPGVPNLPPVPALEVLPPMELSPPILELPPLEVVLSLLPAVFPLPAIALLPAIPEAPAPDAGACSVLTAQPKTDPRANRLIHRMMVHLSNWRRASAIAARQRALTILRMSGA